MKGHKLVLSYILWKFDWSDLAVLVVLYNDVQAVYEFGAQFLLTATFYLNYKNCGLVYIFMYVSENLFSAL